MNLVYSPITECDDSEIQQIIEEYRKPQISQFISIDELKYFDYIINTAATEFYKVYFKNELVATVHIEISENVLYLALVTFVKHQRKGYATQIVKDLQTGLSRSMCNIIKVSIDKNNVASIRLFEKMQFVHNGTDEGLLNYSYRFPEV